MSWKALLFTICSFIFWASPSVAQNPVLSSQAEISILTCSPGNEIYSLFGHSALKVSDPVLGISAVFNYGTFSFGDDFVYNFTMGRLNYKLSLESWDGVEGKRRSFVERYARYGRGVYEQVLNLDSAQKQELFDFLNWNLKPENRVYLYDFFYDNCSSRLRDIVENESGAAVTFANLQESDKPSFRNMINRYLVYTPWTDFGIDLGLGLPCDKVMESRDYMFLPDDLMRGFATATINGKPAVKETIEHASAAPRELPWSIFDPVPLMWLLLGAFSIIAAVEWRSSKVYLMPDLLVLLSYGAVGALVFFLWFITDHNGTENNMNLLWAWPTHLLAIALLFFKKARSIYFLAWGGLLVITLIGFWVWPQALHLATIPLMLIGLTRSLVHWKRYQQQALSAS